jgi:hypothetical protein
VKPALEQLLCGPLSSQPRHDDHDPPQRRPAHTTGSAVLTEWLIAATGQARAACCTRSRSASGGSAK